MSHDHWNRVKLSDVAVQVKDRIAPGTEGPSVYVPGGSINRLNFEVSEWLPVDDGLIGPAFHMIARPGDVLYKSRVPHGVAVADRLGICSNTTYVLRTRDENVMSQRFLPYVLSSLAFLNHESLNDKGSTNLYLNFSDVASYEFALPPLDEQQRIVEILSSADRAIASYLELESANQNLRESTLLNLVWDDSIKDWQVPLVRVTDLLSEPVRNGVSPPASSDGEGSLTVSISAVQDGKFVAKPEYLKWCAPVVDPSAFAVKAGDAFAVRGNGNRLLVGRLGLCTETPIAQVLYPDLLIRLRFNPEVIDPAIATAIWNLRRVHDGLLARAKSSNGIYKVNGQDIANHRLPVPSIETQTTLLRDLKKIDHVESAVRDSLASARDARRAILERLIGMGEHV